MHKFIVKINGFLFKSAIKDTGPTRITSLILSGSLYVAFCLTSLLLAYDILNGTLVRTRFWIACGVIIYLIWIKFLLKADRVNTANWLLILLFESLAFTVLLHWGLTSVIGIVTACFTILLPGVLMTPRLIAPVALITFGLIICTHILHTTGIVVPVTYKPTGPSTILDVLAYGTILAIFALVSWVSAQQVMLSLHRALKAENELRQEKDILAIKLEEESAKLRQAQLQQIQQLHRFAVIGQSTTATLHELSNYLSVLSLDIDDIKQHHHSKAVKNIEESIDCINRMVHKTRKKLGAQVEDETFNAVAIIRSLAKDMSYKFKQANINFLVSIPKNVLSFHINGNSMDLSQCISILLNNALDASKSTANPTVRLSLTGDVDHLDIVVSDTGPGIEKSRQKLLFQPLASTKPSGLGVGLYIAKHLIEFQFKGNIQYVESPIGATFQISLKR